jgi:hypothetical protein
MDFEPNYGSSEYSEKAETLFAGFLLDVERAALHPETDSPPDFEEFCAEHSGYADELYGLHADWDNVRGLVAQMNGLRPSVPPPTPVEPPVVTPTDEELARREALIEPFSADDVRESKDLIQDSSLQSWKRLATGMVTIAILVSLWAANQFFSSRVLAKEKNELVTEQEATREELIQAHSNGEALAQEGKQLADQLRKVEQDKGELETNQEVLNRDLSEARAGTEQLQLSQKELEASLAANNKKLELAAEQTRRAEAQAQVLALGLSASGLLAEEENLWPTNSTGVGELEAWLAGAEAVERLWSEQGSDSIGAPDALTQLLAPSGPVARTRRRLALVNEWQDAARAEPGSQWAAALEDINDPSKSPEFEGQQITPQFGLIPLGRSAVDGLWRFADQQSGSVVDSTSEGFSSASGDAALVFVLIPGMELEGQTIAPFLVSETPWRPEHHLHAFGVPEPESKTELEARIAYDRALVRLDYRPLSRMQAMLARPFGIDVSSWERFPSRVLMD